MKEWKRERKRAKGWMVSWSGREEKVGKEKEVMKERKRAGRERDGREKETKTKPPLFHATSL